MQAWWLFKNISSLKSGNLMSFAKLVWVKQAMSFRVCLFWETCGIECFLLIIGEIYHLFIAYTVMSLLSNNIIISCTVTISFNVTAFILEMKLKLRVFKALKNAFCAHTCRLQSYHYSCQCETSNILLNSLLEFLHLQIVPYCLPSTSVCLYRWLIREWRLCLE